MILEAKAVILNSPETHVSPLPDVHFILQEDGTGDLGDQALHWCPVLA